MSIITYSLLVGLILFLAFVMEQRTNRLRRDFEGLYNLRGRDIEARIALNDKFNSEMAELRDYIVGHFDEGSEFYALRMEVANMWDTMRSTKGISPDMATAKTLQSLFEKDIAFLTEGHYDEAAKLSRAEQSIEILETRMGRVESDAKWRYSDFDVDGRTRLLSPYEIVVSLQSKLDELERKFKNLVGVGSASLTIRNAPEQPQPRVVEIKDPAPLWSPETGEVNIVPQDEPMTPEEFAEWQAAEAAENGAPENLTEQRVTKLEQAMQTKASTVGTLELAQKLKDLRTEVLGGADESGLPIPGALSELRQQVEGINSHLGKKVENATKLNKAAIQLVAQSAARTEVRTILRKRKGFWAVTWGNFWRWLISPVK